MKSRGKMNGNNGVNRLEKEEAAAGYAAQTRHHSSSFLLVFLPVFLSSFLSFSLSLFLRAFK